MSLTACSQATLFERDISWMEDIDINISLDVLKKLADMSNGLVSHHRSGLIFYRGIFCIRDNFVKLIKNHKIAHMSQTCEKIN